MNFFAINCFPLDVWRDLLQKCEYLNAPTHKKRSNAKKTLDISNGVNHLLYVDSDPG